MPGEPTSKGIDPTEAKDLWIDLQYGMLINSLEQEAKILSTNWTIVRGHVSESLLDEYNDWSIGFWNLTGNILKHPGPEDLLDLENFIGHTISLSAKYEQIKSQK
jgi:hypothetical protein